LNWKVHKCLGLLLSLTTCVTYAGEQSSGQEERAKMPASTMTVAKPGTYSRIWLEVRVNETSMARPALLVRLNDGRLFAGADDLIRWRIKLPQQAPFSVRGKEYYPLDTIEGLEYGIEERTQVLLIRGLPNIFSPTRINARSTAYAPPDPPSAGGFLNYDLQYQRHDRDQQLDSLLEFGLFNTWGFGTTTFLGHSLQDQTRLTRLETSWTYDEPLTKRSLRIGDSISQPGSWGRSVRFGGIQWGTEFAIRPDFIPFPLPTLTGEATLPSTVDLYVDNALRLSNRVPAGPFAIQNVPLITGKGEVRLVVRDVLGRERVITEPYYVSADLLRNGLHKYSYSAGFLRRRFTQESNAYGRFFAAGTHRLGLTDRLTGELRAELTADQQTAGAGATYYWPDMGIVNSALALSHSPDGNGALLALGLERQGRPFSFSLHSQASSSGFTQLGAYGQYSPARRMSLARANLSVGNGGSAFVSYLHQSNRAQPDIELVSAGYSVNIFDDYFLSAYAQRSLQSESGYSFGISLTHAFGPRTTGSVGFTRQPGESTTTLQLQRSLPQGSGVGYRLLSETSAQGRQEAALSLQTDVGTYRMEASRTHHLNGQRLSASGGVALMDGSLQLSRRLNDSFAVVRVGHYPDVPVYADNQVVAHTDQDGVALVPSLRAYQKNRLRIEPAALPLDTEINRLEMTLTPRRHSGNLVKFPVRSVRGALLRILLDDGSPLPAGAVVTHAGQDKQFPVARRGEVYVTGLEPQNKLQARWKGKQCTLQVALPADAGPLPKLGPFVCHGVTP